MVNVPSTHLVLFIASIAVAAGVAGAFTAEASRLSGTFDEVGLDLSEAVQTDIEIVTDPGTVVYDGTTDTISIHVQNLGERTLSHDAEQINVFVDGEFIPSSDLSVTVAGASDWEPGAIVRLDIDYQDLAWGDHRVKVVVDGDAEGVEFFNCQGGVRDSVVYQRQSDNTLTTIDRSGTVTNFGFTTKGFAPNMADFDCDGEVEIPYVDQNSGITIIDVDGESQTLVSSGVLNDVVLGVGDLDGDGKPAVVYPNADDNNYLYRVEYNGDNERIATVSAASVAGVADFNDDGDLDVIYTDLDKNLLYLDNGAEQDTGVNPACVTCIGAPKDFDGDGVERVPFKSQNDAEIMLSDHQGNTEVVWNGGDESVGSLGSFDWNEDGTPDIVIVYNADKKLYWIDYTDGSRNGPISDSGGTDVEGDAYGVA